MAISEKLCYLERSSWPANVGIHAMEIYFPKLYVCQQELEKYDGVSQGKYTIGLGQSQMGFCSDREDIHSLCLTVLSKMMERTGIGFQNVGRLDVGTETILDKSKSVKSVLMKLFEESGNNDVEGVDSTNACYGGTAALFNAVNWVESSSWDGRYAVVVAADIAIYPKGPARPTGGAGAVAMLIGPNAPLVIDRGVRSSYMAHNYDFYKPDLASDYPKVDGQLTIQCYFSALDSCYKTYLQKASRLNLELQERQLPTCLEDFGAFAFHSPYCKLVQKSFARLALNDFLSSSSSAATAKHATLMKYHDRRLEDTYFDKEVEKVFMTETKDMFENKTKPSLRLASRVGNMYTPSLYGGLVSILASLSDCDLFGKHIGMFSYGSGTASSMFSILVRSDEESRSHLLRMSQEASTTLRRLDERIEVSPYNFAKVLDERERNHLTIPFTPYAPTSTLFSGSWYLNHVDDQHRRTYSRLFPGPINGHHDSASVGQISSQCNGHVDTNGGSRNLPVDDVRKEASS